MNAVAFPGRPARRRGVAADPVPAQRIALVSGGNRGLGFEISRQLALQGITVLLGARHALRGEQAARALRREGGVVAPVSLDVTSARDVEALAARIQGEYGRLDILINNAGAYFDIDDQPSSVSLDLVRQALETNLLGAWQLTEAMLPLMQRHGYGRIVNVSSGCGAIGSEGSDCPAYRVSKAALNSHTRMLAAELAGSGILVNAVCPGWVATDMGGHGGRPVTEGAAGIVWAATLPSRPSISGGFFRDQQRIDW